jgi:Spy/CpxP family protein refolding chaperone
MKKTLASIALFSILWSPALARDAGDTSGNTAAEPAAAKSEPADPAASTPASREKLIAEARVTLAPLSLSDDQLEKFAKLKADLQDSTAGTATQVHTLNRQLRDLLSKDEVDKSQAMGIQAKLNSLRNDLANAQLKMRLETLAVLSPEQKQKLRHAALQRQVFSNSGSPRGHRCHHHRVSAPESAPPAAVPPA